MIATLEDFLNHRKTPAYLAREAVEALYLNGYALELVETAGPVVEILGRREALDFLKELEFRQEGARVLVEILDEDTDTVSVVWDPANPIPLEVVEKWEAFLQAVSATDLRVASAATLRGEGLELGDVVTSEDGSRANCWYPYYVCPIGTHAYITHGLTLTSAAPVPKP